MLKLLGRSSRSIPFASFASVAYPYIFKGLKSSHNKKSFEQSTFIEAAFGNKVVEGFKESYLATLEALKDKDMPFLTNNM
jgi:hypothetical protein